MKTISVIVNTIFLGLNPWICNKLEKKKNLKECAITSNQAFPSGIFLKGKYTIKKISIQK